MKKQILFITIFALSFSACAKSPEKSKKLETKNVQEQTSIDPRIEKLSKVMSLMSDRAKMEINIDSTSTFLQDLETVLSTEVIFPGETVNQFFLVDKKNYLPEGYVPKNLVKLTKNDHYNISRNDLSLIDYVEEALCTMSDAALEDGIKLMVSSTYRSFEYQTGLFNRYVKQDGYEQAVRYSAPPGTSQHQMGVAIDFGTIDDAFAETRMGKWLNQNAYKYGWSLSFPENYEDITGYMWECWHFRYIGKEACLFQKKYFGDIQQYMIEFIDLWKKTK